MQSSISNFENEESGDDGATNNVGEIDTAVNAKNQIRIEKQASNSHARQQYNNLKSRKSRKEGKRKMEPVINAGTITDDKADNSSVNNRKDIDSDNNDAVSDDSNGAKIQANQTRGKGKRSSLLNKDRTGPRNNANATAVAVADAQAKLLEDANGDPIEIRGVETIEEFFRPEFAQNTQSLDDINDDSEDDEKKESGEKKKSKLKRSSAL